MSKFCHSTHECENYMKDTEEEKTKAHIQIKGSKEAVEKMLKLVEKIEDQGVEVRLTIEKS